MFTGIIEHVGVIESIVGSSEKKICVYAPKIVEDIAKGDSIALDGICLTVEEYTKTSYTCYASYGTVESTTIAMLQKGSHVNLERALLPTTRMGGHFVTGHVDAKVQVIDIRRVGNAVSIWCSVPQEILQYIVCKGSVALHGISLTVSALEANALQITVIPETQKSTTIMHWKPGTQLNIEVDILAKYVSRSIEMKNGGISVDFLANNGFL